MTLEEAGAIALELIRAGKRGDPMPSVPANVPEHAAKHCYNLGVLYREQDERQLA